MQDISHPTPAGGSLELPDDIQRLLEMSSNGSGMPQPMQGQPPAPPLVLIQIYHLPLANRCQLYKVKTHHLTLKWQG